MAASLEDPAPPHGEGRRPGTWHRGRVPERHRADGIAFVRLTPALTRLDHEALMASREYLRSWSDSEWPAADFSLEENRQDLAWHDEEHEAGIAFTYSVLDGAGSRVLGCLYLRPLRDMLLTRGVERPRDFGLAAETPCARGWVRRDEPVSTERRVLAAALEWLAGPRWAFPAVWWTAAGADERQLALVGELGWTCEERVAARPGFDWVLRARGRPGVTRSSSGCLQRSTGAAGGKERA